MSAYPRLYREDSSIYITGVNGRKQECEKLDSNIENLNEILNLFALYVNEVIETCLAEIRKELVVFTNDEMIEKILFDELKRQYYRALMNKGAYEVTVTIKNKFE